MAGGCQIQACEGFWASWFMYMLCHLSEREERCGGGGGGDDVLQLLVL